MSLAEESPQQLASLSVWPFEAPVQNAGSLREVTTR